MSLKFKTLTLFLLTWAAAYSTMAQIPDGDPFVVNTTTTDDQYSPDVAVAPDGTFVVVWVSEEQDGSGWGIFARWFDSDGVALTGEVSVNVFTGGDQVGPRVDGDDSGRFVIVWEDTARGIFARRFNHLGQALSGELDVFASVYASEGSISVNAGGSFVVTWLRTASPDDFVEARLYDSDGLPLGDAFIVVPFARLSGEEETAVELRNDGSFLVAWSDSEEVFAQRYDSAGNPAGEWVQISQLDPMSFRSSALDAGSDDAGRYRVFWATDINLEEVVSMTRTATSTGALGPLTNLGHPTSRMPGFSMAENGDFIVTHFIDPTDLEGTCYDRDQVVLSTFVIAPNPHFYHAGIRLAHRGPDYRELAAVWAEPTTAILEWDIRARLFSGSIFADGFESGDTTRWSESVSK